MQFGYEVFHHNVDALVEFYVRALSFEAQAASSPTEFVVVQRDGLRVGCGVWEGADSTDRPPPLGSEVVLRVPDVEAEYARVLAAGWPIAEAMQDRPWGLRDFRIFDPSGQYIRITTMRPPT